MAMAATASSILSCPVQHAPVQARSSLGCPPLPRRKASLSTRPLFQGPQPAWMQPLTTRRHQLSPVRAEGQGGESSSERPAAGPGPSQPAATPPAAENAPLERGQWTAIVTGVISLVLAIGYLVLIQTLDTRGVNLIPPPPEAFGP
eukprot:jgi/Mesvir1/12642/Mv02197-RA.1